MALILTGKFTTEQVQPPPPDIHAEVVFQKVGVLQATGYVVMDGATPEIRLKANKFGDGVVQIGMLITRDDKPKGGRHLLPEVMEGCVGRNLQFGEDIVGEIHKGFTPASEWDGMAGYTAEILSATLNAADTSRIFVGLGGMSIEELAYFQRADITREEHQVMLDWIQAGRVGEKP